MHKSILPLLLALVGLVACGGGTSRPTTSERAAADDDDDSIVDEDAEDDDDWDDDDDAPIDAAAMRGMMASLEVGEPTEVPGTGVTMRAPANAQPMPFAAGFLALRERVQISVAVVEGEAEVLEALRTGGDPNAPQPAAEAPFEIAGQTGRLGRDEIRTQQGVLERQWLLAHDGTRGLGVIATYEGNRARGYRRPIRQMLESVAWDRAAELDASAALGLDVGPVEGLELSHRSTANLVLLTPNATFPPQPGQVVLTVSPLPARVPEDRAMGICPQLAARFLPAPEDDVTHEADVEGGSLQGCERVATAELPDGTRVAAYAAVLFHEGTPILVTGSVAEGDLTTWQPRFTAAAQSVRVR
ncbi:MAG: hypothetical protein KC619_17655 [Myxococcales bacterium]|nr:hypothetical protein [Myxococcales bacterium]